ncbi:MAG: hypothetical protein IKI58_12110 [Oscillospiraceae bacterium]|nr:hypothetical protein [Oscillospiraceae bacterium]
MIAFYVTVLLFGAVFLGIGIYQKKKYYDCPHFQEVRITGYAKYQNSAYGLSGAVIDMTASAAGLKHPVVDVLLDDGSVCSVRLNVAVTDLIIEKYPEFDLNGRVSVQFFGSSPKIAYLTDHPMAQTVVKTSAPMLIGIALLALGLLLVGADIYYTLTL